MPDDPQASSAYAGRWVARVHGQIIAQGGTPEQALRAAQKSRHKEKPDILYMPTPLPLPPLLDKIRDILAEAEVFLVGGAVRDMLLNRLSRDLDFVLPSNGIASARKVANALHADFMPLDKERDTGRVILTDADGSRTFLDFASWRGATLEEDLRNRDFTLNAIAFDIHTQTIHDPLNGASDLHAKVIRPCTPASFTDDPVRILRAVRQAAEFDLKIEPSARQAMKAAAALLPKVSAERKRDELFKILAGPKPDAALRALDMLGIFPHLLPELAAMKGVTQSEPHIYDVWEHTLSALKHLESLLAALRIGYSAEETNDLFTGLLTLRLGRFREQIAAHFAQSLNADRSVRAALFFAALYHDVEKPASRSVDEAGRIRFFDHDIRGAETASRRARDFNLSNDEIERIEKIVRHHMRFHFFTNRLENEGQEPSRKAIYRFFRDTGEAGVDLVLFGLADLRGTRGPTLTQETWSAALDIARLLLENYWEKPQETVAPPRLLDGNELMKELHLQPGRIIGQLLEAIQEAQATGKISTREEALQFARDWLSDNRQS
ncbi:MAG: HD domain-containing protein [Chloroflexota bacterium]|nr:HD domain-containing protein [Chloroflexota bacterium]MBI5703565.1 HD domain-containing protein [Chloroflexota bacterium]